MFEKIQGMLGGLLRLAHDPKHTPVFHSGGPFNGSGLREDEVPAILRRGPFGGAPRFGTHGGLVGGPVGRFSGRMFDDLAQRRNAEKIFHIHVDPPKSRKRPITDDMAQMCQDLGIEPNMSYEDFRKSLEKTLSRAMGLSRPMLLEEGLHWSPLRVVDPPWRQQK